MAKAEAGSKFDTLFRNKGGNGPVEAAEVQGVAGEGDEVRPAQARQEPPAMVPSRPMTVEPVPALAAVTVPVIDPPLRPAPPRAEATRQLSFRASVFLQGEMRDMMYETGRSQQEIMTEFMTEGFRRWRASRRGG